MIYWNYGPPPKYDPHNSQRVKFDPNTGEKLPEPPHKSVEQVAKEQLAMEKQWIANYMKLPKRQYGAPYVRADGKYATGLNGRELPWINEETEKQLLRDMLTQLFKDAGMEYVIKK